MICGIDLGAKCGYALIKRDLSIVKSGTWKLGKRSGSSILLFEQNLLPLLGGVTFLCYEKVDHHLGIAAAHAYGGYEAILLKVAHVCNICNQNVLPIPVKTIKLLASGSGGASKKDIIESVNRRWGIVPSDDNEADALSVAYVGLRIILNETRDKVI